MEKKVSEVFPNLKLPAGLSDLMDVSTVTKVAINPDHTLLCVYLDSSQWIAKEDIYQLESLIERQLFQNIKLRVHIIEHFHLSSQYNVQNFFEMYRPSILLELERYNKVIYSMFKNAEISFRDEKTMRMVLPDAVISREKYEHLEEILEKIFVQRCGLDFHLESSFKRFSDETREKEKEEQINDYVNRLMQQVKEIRGKSEAVAEPAPEQTKEKRKTKEHSGKKEPAKTAPGKGRRVPGPAGERRSFRAVKKSDNPDVIYGRDPEEATIDIETISGEMGEVTIRGQILTMESREIRNEKTILMFNVTDFTDTITVKMFLENEQVPEITGRLKKGGFVKIKGRTTIDKFDHELSIASVQGIKSIGSFVSVREDHAARKRVELHCHTKMSDMDGVSDASAIIKRAKSWGHPAVAVTDHGVVQAFPEASHTYDAVADDDFKVIYGVEAYLVDDLKDIVYGSHGQSIDSDFVVFDIETTGFSPVKDKIIEIGAVRVEKGQITARFSEFVNPRVPIPFRIENLTGINDGMVADAEPIEVILPKFMQFCEGSCLCRPQCGF